MANKQDLANKKELENMVMQFKVSDLQLLLGFAGQNKNGRKQDLQKKALNLIYYKMSIPLEMKIRHIYREMVAENNARPMSDYFYPNFDKYDNYYVNNGYSNTGASSRGYDTYNSQNYYSNNNVENNYYDNWSRKNVFNTNCNNTESFDYMSYLEPCAEIPDNQKLKNIVFKKLSFFRYKSDIVPVTPVIPKSKRTDLFEYTSSFTLNPQQQTLINLSKKNDKECRYQVQLRMCLLNAGTGSRKEIIEDALPLALGVKLNDKACQLPPAIPSTNKQGMLLKRMNAPINLTPQISKKNHPNTLVINWTVECDKLYGISIHFVEKFSSDDLIKKLKDKGERDPAVTKKYVGDKLNEMADDDIAATSLKVSLICPLGKILMSLPVRATTCNHLQCFDGMLYIKMNEVKSVWQCPVCNQTCYYEDLFIDGYFTDILKNENFNTNVTEIQINDDGSVVPVVPKKRSNTSPDRSTQRKRMKTIDEECIKKVPPVKEKSKEEPAPSFLPLFSTASADKETPEKSNLISSIEQDIRELLSSVSSCHENTNESSSSSVSSIDSASLLTLDSAVSTTDTVSVSTGDTTSVSTVEPDNDSEVIKNVVLVDLTETDSENEECESNNAPLNLKKIKDDAPSSPEETCQKSFPPVYDIEDSD